MICNECHNKPICVIYADIMKHAGYTEIKIEKCDYRKLIYESYRKDEKIEKMKIASTEIDPFTGKLKVDRDKIDKLSKQKSYEKEVAKKNMKKNEQKDPKIKI